MGTSNILYQYQNGNTHVTILTDGTKIREYENIPVIIHPESIDVKITDYCTMGCKFCHESSTRRGKHGDLTKLLEIIKDLPAGVELAIGGGNPLDHPDLIPFLETVKERGLIANITVNQGHLKGQGYILMGLIANDLVKGVGISINGKKLDHIRPFIHISDNIVFHVIAGVHDLSIIPKLLEFTKLYNKTCKVLVLGYKVFGFGIDYFSDKVIQEINVWKNNLKQYVGKVHLSFDNLAIEQLDIRSWFNDRQWDNFYMGDDFQFTMYIDAVNQQYAPTSRSDNRVSFDNKTLLEYFKK